MKVFLMGGGGGGARWETQQGRPPRRVSTCRPRSQFGGHEVDVRLDQGEERQAPLELRHVLNQRGLQGGGERGTSSLVHSAVSLINA